MNNDNPLPAKEAAKCVGVSLSAFWRGVAAGYLPAPVYPMPRAPRWYPSELRATVETTRSLPVDAKEKRRKAKISANKITTPNK
jgi:predicted DNA-binding transcriptional regulator AlpA